jgi:hypothetical protein
MIGGAIYGSSKDEAGMDAVGVIGGTLSLMGFNMPQGGNAGHMAGALFRSKAYNNPDDTFANNIARGISTEFSLGVVGKYVTPKLTEVINRNIVAPLLRNNMPIAESGVSAIIGSFVGAIAMNMLDSGIQRAGGLLRDNFSSGDNDLNSRINNLQDAASSITADRNSAKDDPLASRFVGDDTDKLEMPPLVLGVWAGDAEFESLSSDSNTSSSYSESYFVGGQEGYA